MLLDLLWLLWHWQEIELKLIDWGSACLSTESLQKGGRESSWVSEGSDPEVVSGSLDSPFLEELISILQVIEPVGEWLQ